MGLTGREFYYVGFGRVRWTGRFSPLQANSRPVRHMSTPQIGLQFFSGHPETLRFAEKKFQSDPTSTFGWRPPKFPKTPQNVKNRAFFDFCNL